MTEHKLMPNEVFVTEFGAIIRTRCPKESVTEQMIHQRVVAANLAAGDVVRVQCLSHDRNAVLHFAEYLVFERRDEMKRLEINDRETRNVEQASFSVMKTRDWQATPAGEADAAAKAAKAKEQAPPPAPAGTGESGTVRWNPGKQAHEVVNAAGAVIASYTKEQGGKEAAEAFAGASKAAA